MTYIEAHVKIIETAITATKTRENIYQLIQDVNANCTPVTITNSRGKNAVLIGEEDWKSIEETLYLMSIPGMAESIMEGGNTYVSDFTCHYIYDS